MGSAGRSNETRAKAMDKRNCWVERKKPGRDVMRRTPAAVGNSRTNLGRSRRQEIWSLAMRSRSRRAARRAAGENRNRMNLVVV